MYLSPNITEIAMPVYAIARITVPMKIEFLLRPLLANLPTTGENIAIPNVSIEKTIPDFFFSKS